MNIEQATKEIKEKAVERIEEWGLDKVTENLLPKQ